MARLRVRSRQRRRTTAQKRKERLKLEAKGVPRRKAKELTGEDEDLDDETIANRRIAWQRTLPKA